MRKFALIFVSVAFVATLTPISGHSATTGVGLGRGLVAGGESTEPTGAPSQWFVVFGAAARGGGGGGTNAGPPAEEHHLQLQVSIGRLQFSADELIGSRYPADPLVGGSSPLRFTGKIDEGTCEGQPVEVVLQLEQVGAPLAHQSYDPDFNVGGTTFHVSGEAALVRLVRIGKGSEIRVPACQLAAPVAGGEGLVFDGASNGIEVGTDPNDGGGAGDPRPTALGFETPVSSDGSVVDLIAARVLGVDEIRSSEGSGVGYYEPPAVTGSGPLTTDASEDVIGADGRVQITNTTNFPARASAWVTFTNSKGNRVCSAWMINHNTAATAGHCVYDQDGNVWSWNVVVWPGRNGASTPYGGCSAKRLYSVEGWTINESEQYDYGAIKLNCSIGNTTGWYGFFWQSSSLSNLPVYVRGYPADKPSGTQWKSWDDVDVSYSKQTFYAADTAGGMSGSPVYYNRAGCGKCSMAFHAYGRHGAFPHGTYNHGTRITEARFNNMLAWRAAA